MKNPEQYFTPPWLVDLYFQKVWPREMEVNCILEPCMGAGAFVNGAHRNGKGGLEIESFDVDPKAHLHARGVDFLSWKWSKRYDVLVTNPPFTLAQKFAMRGMQCAWVTTLLVRQSFLSTQKRGEWLKENRPYSVHIVTRRPTFELSERQREWLIYEGKDPDKWGSDNAEYCFVTWLHESIEVEETRLEWL